MLATLAQAASRSIGPVLINLGVLIVIVVAMGFFILLVRKRMLGSDRELGAGSLLGDLKQMRDAGNISQAEYDYLRKSIAARAAGQEPPPRPAEPAAPELRARPGFDLTGEPLPPEVIEAMRRQSDAKS
ncbi:MAG: hypothetical protein Kow0022_12150 [Phycisphaerales bacterium]